MNSGWKTKGVFALAATLIAAWAFAPNFFEKKEAQLRTGIEKLLPSSRINLGLDLQGGTHMVLGIDLARALQNEADTYANDLKQLLEKEGLAFETLDRTFENSNIVVKLANQNDSKKLEEIIQNRFNVLSVKDNQNPTYTLDISDQRKVEIETQTRSQALETLRNRIDEFGVAEPSIQAQGHDRIVVQLPGLENPERAKNVLGKTAQLEFKIVDDESLTESALVQMVEDVKKASPEKPADKWTARDLNHALKDKLPASTQVLMKEFEDNTLKQKRDIPLLVKLGEKLSGDMLEHAQMGFDENNFPEVHLRFNPAGTTTLDELSNKNIGKRLAIVLDDKVYSDPVLQSRISDGRPRITFGGLKSRGETFAEAKDLAVVLRAGALPAPVEILETRTVGPSLGRDSIEHGFKAIVLGVVLVVLFMMIYYRLSGFFANVALTANILFILACLSLLGGTLTLPGIAGILISIGMAVDANVIIFERIREELRAGKSVRSAIDQGFDRAHITILDSNITTILTGIVLLQYGTGPIKGFAITLIFGLIANYFTAIWFTRILYEWYVGKFNPERLSI